MLAQIATYLEWISAGAAILSGCFWIRSALIRVPWVEMGFLDGPTRSVMQALQRQTRSNAIAAWFAAATGIAQGMALIIRKCLLP